MVIRSSSTTERPEVLGPFGACIYCGAADGPLTREHVMPRGLGGGFILRAGSCVGCQRVTQALEDEALRSGAMRPLRAALGMSSRRARPNTAPLILRRDGREERIEVPLDQHPQMVRLPVFRPPAFLDRRELDPARVEIACDTVAYHPNPKALRRVAVQYGVSEIGVPDNVPIFAFARMIGKIGFGYAVARLGRDAIDEAWVLPSVLGHGDRMDIFRWVGTESRAETASETGATHLLGHEVRQLQNERGCVVLAYVRLFARGPSPRYQVVVGLSNTLEPTP